DRINQTLAFRLQQSMETPAVVYDRLKTHRTITALACTVDRTLISSMMKSTAAEAAPNLGQRESELLARQLDYYAAYLEKNKTNPVVLREDEPAEAKAREYIQNAGGYEQRFRAILAALRAQMRPALVSEIVGNYKSVLKGREDYDAVFTRKGLEAFDLQVDK